MSDLSMASGCVRCSDPVAVLMYLLLKEHVSPEIMNRVVEQVQKAGSMVEIDNGWLGRYALYLSQQLRGDGVKPVVDLTPTPPPLPPKYENVKELLSEEDFALFEHDVEEFKQDIELKQVFDRLEVVEEER